MILVQIGTCRADDNVFEFVNSGIKIDKLILVEPMKIHNEKIIDSYKNIKNVFLENVAITTDGKNEISFYYHENDGPYYEVASTEINHILKHGYTIDKVIEIKVKSININQLFEKHNLKDIDFLVIDSEGLDDSIIKTINFEKYNISEIYFEYLHLKNNDVYEFLEKMGYDIIRDLGKNHPNVKFSIGWSSLAIKKNFNINK